MGKLDWIAETNRRHWAWAVETSAGFTVPWLDLDVETLHRYADGMESSPPDGLDCIYPAGVLQNVEGKDVLCLASGGGQQSAVFGLLGARVTVVDLTEGQLAGDRSAAQHYGYKIATVCADMRDLSDLADTSFDLVYQGNSFAWIPDVRQVYAGVARVLRAGGIYRFDVANPATEFVEPDAWNGEGYSLSVPYAVTEQRLPEPGSPGTVQFRHHMGDVLGGLLAEGLVIEEVEDAPSYFGETPEAEPGTWHHWLRYVGGFAIVAQKP